jgi:hypothetical protein
MIDENTPESPATFNEQIADAVLNGQNVDEAIAEHEAKVATPAESEDQAAPSTEVPAVQPVVLGDKTYNPDELATLVDLGKTYQENKEQVDLTRQLLDIWNSGPAAQQAVIAEMQKLAGIAPVQQTPEPTLQAPKVDFDDLSDEGKMLYLENQHLRQTLTEVKGTMQEVQSMAKSATLERAATEAAAKVSEALGQPFTPTDIITAMQKTGLKDPEAAILAVKGKELIAKARDTGAVNAKAPKPPAPVANAKTFSWNDVDGDEGARLLMQGYVAVDFQSFKKRVFF